MPLPNDEKINDPNSNNAIENPTDFYKSSEALCKTKPIKNSVIKKCKLWNRIHILASITSLLLLVLLLISKWVPSFLNGSESSENTTSITYTNVVITPCGNYFWHSAGGAGGNWQSSDLASKNDEKMLEDAANTGVNLGYNRIIGQY